MKSLAIKSVKRSDRSVEGGKVISDIAFRVVIFRGKRLPHNSVTVEEESGVGWGVGYGGRLWGLVKGVG